MARALDRYALFYPMRFVGTTFVGLLVVLHATELNRWNAYHVGLVVALAIHPHVVLLIARQRAHDRERVERIAFLVDAFILGLAVHLTGFSLLPSLILITVGLVNGMAVGGFPRLLVNGMALAAGILAPMPFLGVNFDPKNAFGVNLACSIFLFVYFNFFAWSAHNRNALLVRSQAELQERTATLEIEKMRSDRLVLNVVPSGLAAEFARTGRLEPRILEPVTLLAIGFDGFTTALENRDPREALDLLTRAFQAYDAVAGRHGLEKLETMGDLYLAVAGVPSPSERDAASAVRAALEIRDYLSDLEDERRAHGLFMPTARIAVHSGRVIGALVETEKASYDLFGTAVRDLLRLHRGAAPRQVLISDATRRLAGEGFALEPGPELEEVPCWSVDAPRAGSVDLRNAREPAIT